MFLVFPVYVARNQPRGVVATDRELNDSHINSVVLVRPVWVWTEGAQEPAGLVLSAHCVGRLRRGHRLDFLFPLVGQTDAFLWL